MLNKILSSISTVTNHGAPVNFKFVIGDRIEYPNALFELYNGKPKNGIINIPGIPDMTKLTVSILVYRKPGPLAGLAANAMRKLLTLRHPSILKVLDSGESDSGIFIATEHVVPLPLVSRPSSVPMHSLYQIAKALAFLHEDAHLVHGTIDPVNVFVTDSGSYRLGGFELCKKSFDSSFFYEKRNLEPILLFRRIDCRDVSDIDTFQFVLLVHYLVHGPSLPVPEGSTTLSSLIESITRKSPPSVVQLLNDILRSRNVSPALTSFAGNETIQICDYLDSIHGHDIGEANRFLESLSGRLVRIDPSVQQSVILDLLLNNVVSITSLIPAALMVITEICANCPKDLFQCRIEPKFVDFFAIQDRSIRFRLLTSLPRLIDLFTPAVLEQNLLIETLSGFTDSHPSIREETLKGIVEMSKKINPAAIEKRIVPNLIKLLKDPEPSIRTNAMVSVAKVASLLGSEDRQKELLTCIIVGGLRDVFPACRCVALETLQTFPIKSEGDAKKVSAEFLPLVCPLLMDPEVGRQAVNAIDQILTCIRKFSPSVTAPAPSRTTSVMPTSFPESRRSVPSARPTVSRPATTATKIQDSDFDSFWNDVKPPANEPFSLI
jgi:SCY1-like protein 1